jgi:molybdopterin/thiamine biosynthesis adenylyltransferase
VERLFDGRPGFVFEPIVAKNQSPEVEPYLEQAHVILSCANELEARLYVERAAIAVRKPSVQAAIQDARQALGGVITSWMPGSEGCCFGCLFSQVKVPRDRSEVLLPTVARTIASLAAHIVLEIITGRKSGVLRHNVLVIDLRAHSLERLEVQRRPGCRVCGGPALGV